MFKLTGNPEWRDGDLAIPCYDCSNAVACGAYWDCEWHTPLDSECCSLWRWIRQKEAWEDQLLSHTQSKWVLGIYGKQAVDAAYALQNGSCYHVYKREGKPVCQVEAVLDEPDGGLFLVDIQLWNKLDFFPAIRYLMAHGFKGCWVEVIRRLECENIPIAIEETTAAFRLGKEVL